MNPRTGYEFQPAPPAANPPKSILVVGGGPAGMELAAAAAERGHRVTLWERDEHLGGQMRIAAQVAENKAFGDFIEFQVRRLERLGVNVKTRKAGSANTIADAGFDIVAVATGSAPRRHEAPGAHLPFVLEGRDVMQGNAEAGQRVVVVAMEDHMQPLTIASFLVEQGKDVQLIYQTPAIAPLIGKYSIGAPLAKITAAGGKIRVMERVTSIEQGRIETANVYSGAASEITDFDSVVLACGGTSENGLYHELQSRRDELQADLHILGDAYAPRRIWFATRQAYALAATL